MPSRRSPEVRAAGTVVWRPAADGLQVAVVHRPRYDDWSLPKGKLHEGEQPVAAAVRETAEETGFTVALSRRLPAVDYQVAGRHKQAAYWLARRTGGEFAPGDEVDELAWLTPESARRRLSYPNDRRVVQAVEAAAIPDAVIVLVRHARAGRRSAWHGEDRQRPLDRTGRRQAEALAGFLPAFAPARVVSAEPVRCTQTAEPYAARAGLEIEVDDRLGDAGYHAEPEATLAALTGLARPGSVTAVVSQGQAIPGLLGRLCPGRRLPDTKKADAWVLGFAGGAILHADHYPDAAR